MSYIIKQMIRGKPYAYRVDAYWDKEEKQSRQKRTYLGKIDEVTGEIIPKTAEREISLSKTFGPAYLLANLAEQSGLVDKLRAAFGSKAEAILAAATMRVIRPEALRNLQPLLEESYLPELIGLEKDLSSQRMSELLISIGKDEKSVRDFFRSQVKKEDVLIFDITSFSSRSRQLDLLEFGSDYRSTGLPQINFGMVVSMDSGMPLFYKLFPGSITDVVTLKNLMLDAKDLGVQKCLYILDRGFYSLANVERMLQEGLDFIMPLPFGKGLAKTLVSRSNKPLDDPRCACIFDGEVYRVHESSSDFKGGKVRTFVIVGDKRMMDERRTLYSRVADIERTLEGMDWHPRMRVTLRSVAKRLAPLFSIKNVNGKVHVERRRNAMAQALNRCGKMVLLTSTDMNWQGALTIHLQRFEVEAEFDQLKDPLDMEPLRVSSPDSFKGLMFVAFVSLVLRTFMLRRAVEAKLLDKRWIDDMLLELAKLKVTKIGEEWRLNEVTKKQRELIAALGVTPPYEL
jgi:transposase